MSPRLRWAIFLGLLGVAGLLFLQHVRTPFDREALYARLPDPDRLNQLSYYLTPVAEDTGGRASPPGIGEDPFDPPASMALGQSAPAPAPEARYDVSAIFVSEGRRVAIVNQRTVRPGDALPGGTVVEAIESDRVVVVDPAGRRRVLRF